jgi:hypothetical protein
MLEIVYGDADDRLRVVASATTGNSRFTLQLVTFFYQLVKPLFQSWRRVLVRSVLCRGTVYCIVGPFENLSFTLRETRRMNRAFLWIDWSERRIHLRLIKSGALRTLVSGNGCWCSIERNSALLNWDKLLYRRDPFLTGISTWRLDALWGKYLQGH